MRKNNGQHGRYKDIDFHDTNNFFTFVTLYQILIHIKKYEYTKIGQKKQS